MCILALTAYGFCKYHGAALSQNYWPAHHSTQSVMPDSLTTNDSVYSHHKTHNHSTDDDTMSADRLWLLPLTDAATTWFATKRHCQACDNLGFLINTNETMWNVEIPDTMKTVDCWNSKNGPPTFGQHWLDRMVSSLRYTYGTDSKLEN